MFLIDSHQFLTFEDNEAIDPTVKNAVMKCIDTNFSMEIDLPPSILNHTNFGTEYALLLNGVNKEPDFKGLELKYGAPLTMIAVQDKIVGCFISAQVIYNKELYYRDARPFIHEEFRKNGYYFDAMSFWYKKRTPALAHIFDSNEASIRLYEKLGFRKEVREDVNGNPAHIYLLK